MNLALFYDTETAGLPLWKQPDDHPSQPHLVQVAAHLVDMDTRDVVQSIDLIVKPDDWIIPDEVAAIHGITTEHANEVGVPEDFVLRVFGNLWKSRLRVAHNESFDARIIRIGLTRFTDADVVGRWRNGEAECTSDLTINDMNLPPSERMKAAGFNGPKKPRMSEAYKHYTGMELVNAHSAIADVNACMEVYWAVKDNYGANV